MAGAPHTLPKRQRPAEAPAGAASVLVIVGPTASGKTALGLALAGALGGEIISADSQQVYRDLDVGTAKPTPEERSRVPHHLVDVAEPTQTMSAGAFARLADEEIAKLTAKGKLPIVVGGTGLWVRALLLGIIDAPPADAVLRSRLEEEAKKLGREAMHARLAEIDPETAAAIPDMNPVRMLRALEIHALTGERPSALRARHGFGQLRYRARVLGISPPREELYRRIDARAKAMFEGGLIDEVRGLVARGLSDAPALKAIGYREALSVVKGECSIDEAAARTAQATRRYAKRQLTWFRADPLVEWLPWPVEPRAVADELSAWARSD